MINKSTVLLRRMDTRTVATHGNSAFVVLWTVWIIITTSWRTDATDAGMYGYGFNNNWISSFQRITEPTKSSTVKNTKSNRRSLDETTFAQRIKKLQRQKQKNNNNNNTNDKSNQQDINDMLDQQSDAKYDYVTRSIEHLGWMNPDAAIGNPLRGFVSYPEFSGYQPHIAESIIDISLEAYYIGLDELMIDRNTFDWESLERRLNDTADRNRHSILSVVCHYPNWHVLSVPQFIIDDGLKLLYYPDFLGGGYSPDYGDEKLLTALQQFITAFGKRYDGDQRIAFINLGLLGFWGEWHTYPNDFVPDHARQSVVSWYQKSFQTTKLLARYPHKAAYKAGFGLSDGSFTYETIDGEANGNETRPHYFWPSVVHAKQANFWKKAPMGGETRPEQQPIVFEPSYPKRTYHKQDFMECVSTTHATFIGHHDMFISDGYKDEELANALHAHARMGYNFMITKVGAIFPNKISDEASVQIDVKIDQVGVAPFYYPLSLFLDCPDLSSPMEISGIERLISEGDSKVISFRNVPCTAKCMKAVQFRLNSTVYSYRNRPIKFAQGQHGTVELRIPLPSSLSDKTSRAVERDPYIVYNLINVNMNVGTSVTELKNGDSIDLSQVGRSVSIQADVYYGSMELAIENVSVEFRFKGRVHYEHNYPFLLAGRRGDVYARSVYLSTIGMKTIQTIVYDKRNKEILLDQTITLIVVNSNNDIEVLSQESVVAPMMPRSTVALEHFRLSTPSISPKRIMNDSSNEIHGFNTPITPPLLILVERQRRKIFRFHVVIPILSTVTLALALLSCLVYRRSKRKHSQNTNHRIGDSVPDGVYNNPI